MILAGTHTPCQSGLVDNAKSRMLEWGSLSELMADGRDGGGMDSRFTSQSYTP